MRLVALDLSLTTGVAAESLVPGVPRTWRIDLPPPGQDCGGTFATFHRRLIDILKTERPERVAYESIIDPQVLARRNSPVTTRIMQGLAAYVEGTCVEYGIPTEHAHPQSIKVYWTGVRSATKGAMLARCRQLQWDVHGSHDEADAVALWAYIHSLRSADWSLKAGNLV